MPEGVLDEPNSGLFCVLLVPNENFGGSPPDMLAVLSLRVSNGFSCVVDCIARDAYTVTRS